MIIRPLYIIYILIKEIYHLQGYTSRRDITIDSFSAIVFGFANHRYLRTLFVRICRKFCSFLLRDGGAAVQSARDRRKDATGWVPAGAASRQAPQARWIL